MHGSSVSKRLSGHLPGLINRYAAKRWPHPGWQALASLAGPGLPSLSSRRGASGQPQDDIQQFNQAGFHSVHGVAQELDDFFGALDNPGGSQQMLQNISRPHLAQAADDARGGVLPGGHTEPMSASAGAPSRLSHLDHRGNANMVDVGQKEATRRTATAVARIRLSQEVFQEVFNPVHLKKGNVIETARIAGIMAAKRTPTLIPMCHTVPLDNVTVIIEPQQSAEGPQELAITATAAATHRTGVEMEALTAAAVAGLTVYDMCKAMDHGIVLDGLQLIHKSGGKTGTWVRPD